MTHFFLHFFDSKTAITTIVVIVVVEYVTIKMVRYRFKVCVFIDLSTHTSVYTHSYVDAYACVYLVHACIYITHSYVYVICIEHILL